MFENTRAILEGSWVNGKDISGEPRWAQTGLSAKDAEKKWGKKNVKVTKGGLRTGGDMVEVFGVFDNKGNRKGGKK